MGNTLLGYEQGIDSESHRELFKMHSEIHEIDDSGQIYAIYVQESSRVLKRDDSTPVSGSSRGWSDFLKGVFLPAGYPVTVSTDYLQCQIYYGIQAFCSSLAGLIASRAVLEGHGIGNADASATDAMLLTVLQDAFSRLTTILGAYYLGTSLYPEAKTYRLVADIANDVAIILDLLSPQLSHYSLIWVFPFIAAQPGAALRISALCFSGAFRALCGVAAGGSRAALTIHFAQDGNVPGDVGDLSAKDASKETVLALVGMLLGSLIIPHLQTAESTYAVVCILLAGHLLANYVAVRVIVMCSLNQQRTSLLWSAYREHTDKGPSKRVLSRDEVAKREFLFGRGNALLNNSSGTANISGYAKIGSSFGDIIPAHVGSLTEGSLWTTRLLELFEKENFVVWIDTQPSFGSAFFSSLPQFHILLKEGHTPADHVKAWAFACDLAMLSNLNTYCQSDTTLIEKMQGVKEEFDVAYETFVKDIKHVGWDVDTSALVSGSPRVLSFVAVESDQSTREDKKTV